MNTKLADVLSFLFVVTTIAMAAYLYPGLPEQIPTHWNAAGEVDDYTAKPWGVILLPLSAVGCWIIMKLIPAISPKGFRVDGFRDVVNVFQVVLVGFMSIVAVLVLLEAGGIDVRINYVVQIGVGLLFVVLGNYLGKVRKNFFIGIRTPWTLASDEVWARTHRLAGWLFALGGLVIIAGGFLGIPPYGLIVVLVVVAVIPIVYSFVAYKRIEGFTDTASGSENDRRSA